MMHGKRLNLSIAARDVFLMDFTDVTPQDGVTMETKNRKS